MKGVSRGDEKPLFPRLHVNDTEKGGPRGPPRNKMALYEQLSITSQRFRSGSHHSSSKESVPPACTGQEHVHDSRSCFSVQAPSLRHTPEKPLKSYPRQDSPISQVELQKKLDGDDFTVPIFLHSRKDQHAGRNCHSSGIGKPSPSNQIHSHYSMILQDSTDENIEQNAFMQVRNNTGRQNKGSCKDTVSNDKEEAFRYSLYSNEAEHPLQRRNTYEKEHDSPENLSGINMADMQPDIESGHLKKLQTLEMNHSSSTVPLRKALPEDLQNHDRQYRIEPTCESIQMIHEDSGEESSETSGVESISATDMSPDNVVGIIGLEHFWKARSAIVKQQRAFAIQVFELHRLIKVQKLIAESPHILLEDIAHIAKPVVTCGVKKLQLEYTVKAPTNILKHRADFEEMNRKRERSAENVGEASLSSVQKKVSQPPECKQLPSRPPLTPNVGEYHTGPWSSYPSQAHQWLIPVMSPTEGLIYKPYSGPGFTGPAPGLSSFHPPGYGVLPSHHQYPGMGVPTYVPPAVPHGYFPSYSMPAVNAISNNHSIDHYTMQAIQPQFSGGGANFGVRHPDSLYLPSQNSGANPDVLKSNEPIASDVQFSTASCPDEKAQAQCVGLDITIDGNNQLSAFPSSPAIDNPRCSPKGDRQARVIRVVPHNHMSATESAARIFRSIQEERKRSDVV